MIDFPEGIELYDVVVAPQHMDTLAISLSHPDAFPTAVTIIRRMFGPWGWNEELRILVVFGGAPLPLFEGSYVTDDEISLECASGRRLLKAERRQQALDWRNGIDQSEG